MHLLIVRHALVHYGTRPAFDPNPYLTGLGVRQAAALADRLAGAGLTHVYTSPAVRCLQTASSICAAAGLPASVVPWLSESGWVWGYAVPPLTDLRRHFQGDVAAEPVDEEWAMARDERADIPRVADSALAARGQAVARTLFGRHPREGTDRVCLVTHAGFGAASLLPSLLGVDRATASGDFDNATLTELRCEPGRTRILRSNDGRHLAGLQAVLCSNPACAAEPSPHWEDQVCRLCGSPMLAKCPHCGVAAIPNPVPARCPECAQSYR